MARRKSLYARVKGAVRIFLRTALLTFFLVGLLTFLSVWIYRSPAQVELRVERSLSRFTVAPVEVQGCEHPLGGHLRIRRLSIRAVPDSPGVLLSPAGPPSPAGSTPPEAPAPVTAPPSSSGPTPSGPAPAAGLLSSPPPIFSLTGIEVKESGSGSVFRNAPVRRPDEKVELISLEVHASRGTITVFGVEALRTASAASRAEAAQGSSTPDGGLRILRPEAILSTLKSLSLRVAVETLRIELCSPRSVGGAPLKSLESASVELYSRASGSLSLHCGLAPGPDWSGGRMEAEISLGRASSFQAGSQQTSLQQTGSQQTGSQQTGSQQTGSQQTGLQQTGSQEGRRDAGSQEAGSRHAVLSLRGSIKDFKGVDSWLPLVGEDCLACWGPFHPVEPVEVTVERLSLYTWKPPVLEAQFRHFDTTFLAGTVALELRRLAGVTRWAGGRMMLGNEMTDRGSGQAGGENHAAEEPPAMEESQAGKKTRGAAGTGGTRPRPESRAKEDGRAPEPADSRPATTGGSTPDDSRPSAELWGVPVRLSGWLGSREGSLRIDFPTTKLERIHSGDWLPQSRSLVSLLPAVDAHGLVRGRIDASLRTEGREDWVGEFLFEGVALEALPFVEEIHGSVRVDRSMQPLELKAEGRGKVTVEGLTAAGLEPLAGEVPFTWGPNGLRLQIYLRALRGDSGDSSVPEVTPDTGKAPGSGDTETPGEPGDAATWGSTGAQDKPETQQKPQAPQTSQTTETPRTTETPQTPETRQIPADSAAAREKSKAATEVRGVGESPDGKAGAEARGSIFGSVQWNPVSKSVDVRVRCAALRVLTGVLQAADVRGEIEYSSGGSQPRANLSLAKVTIPAQTLWHTQKAIEFESGKCSLSLYAGRVAVDSLRLLGSQLCLRARGEVQLTGEIDLLVFIVEGPGHLRLSALSDESTPTEWRSAAGAPGEVGQVGGVGEVGDRPRPFRAFRLTGRLRLPDSRELGAQDPVFLDSKPGSGG